MTVDEHFAETPEPQPTTLAELRATALALLPNATEGISYGVPTFKVDGLAVAGYGRSKGTLRFPIDEPLPETLVDRLVRVRLDELGRSP
jgi:uncharacterized protein YdhG (YjbR/CyaY superfamily)